MNKLILPRRFWYERNGNVVNLNEDKIYKCSLPLVVLGEAGMGKTQLTKRLSQLDGHVGCTARQLYRHSARTLLGSGTTLVIDALDEVGTRDEGDAVDLILGKLGEAGFPRFILTCRVADWQNATAVSALNEDYPDRQPIILHLKPLINSDILKILADRLPTCEVSSEIWADQIIRHFRKFNLDGLLSNPQTLELIARISAEGALPETKSALFAKAVDVLRREHRDEKIALQPDQAAVLDAAGAAFAALILTGAEAVVRDVAEPDEFAIPFADIVALPSATTLGRVIGSRLFEGASAERFTYWHRSIGEYLGARWLAAQTHGSLARRRLLQLFHADTLVPASLRGIHAWLAHQGDYELAIAVINRDPMGAIEYGDINSFGLTESRTLLIALNNLSQRDPHFREWKSYPIQRLLQPALLHDVRALIINPEVEFGLRALLLEALPESPIADPLRIDLRQMLLNSSELFAHRSYAADALIALGNEDWQDLSEQLLEEGSENSLRLALEAAVDLEDMQLTDCLLVALVLRRAEITKRTGGLYYRFEKVFPDSRLDNFLDTFVASLPKLGNRHERPNNDELTDLGYDLIARRLKLGPVEPLRFWRWLRPFDQDIGFSRGVRRAVHDHIRADDNLRRAVQLSVLFDEMNDKTLWQRAVGLTSRSPGFAPNEDDILLLFDRLQPGEIEGDRWKDLVSLVRHTAIEGRKVRDRAKHFVANRPDMLTWIDRLAETRIPEWQVKQEKEKRRRESKRARDWQENRKHFQPHVEEMRIGDIRWLVDPARAYMGDFRDLRDDIPPHERLSHWLGQDISQVAHEGFETFLLSDSPPTAQQIAGSYAESQQWPAARVIVAGLAERFRRLKGSTFYALSNDRILGAFHELRYSASVKESDFEELKESLESEIERRKLLELAARQWIEPQFAAENDHVDHLYAITRESRYSAFALKLTEEWLNQFPNMASNPEAELLDQLLRNGQFDFLQTILSQRRDLDLSAERRANWNAVAFVVNFNAEREQLEAVVNTDRSWLWALRNRLGGDRRQSGSVRLTPAQLAWIFSNFRSLFPRAGYPSGGWAGDTNAWDASDFLLALATKLADETSEDAVRQLVELRDAPADSYTDALRARVAEQIRKAVQEGYKPVELAGLRVVVESKPPTSVTDLQATMLVLFENAQARIKSSPDDVWRGFYDDNNQPRNEERCRDHLLTILGLHPEGIDLLPEGHLADDKRADIIALRPGLRLPIEIKGQWHDELWRAADTQLDRLYAADYAADRRGIYLVLWFGYAVGERKRPRAQVVGQRRPQSPEELLNGLVRVSTAAQAGRIIIVVLDLSRSSS